MRARRGGEGEAGSRCACVNTTRGWLLVVSFLIDDRGVSTCRLVSSLVCVGSGARGFESVFLGTLYDATYCSDFL